MRFAGAIGACFAGVVGREGVGHGEARVTPRFGMSVPKGTALIRGGVALWAKGLREADTTG